MYHPLTRKTFRRELILTTGIVVLLFVITFLSFFVRLDFAAGSHRITPTAVNLDFLRSSPIIKIEVL